MLNALAMAFIFSDAHAARTLQTQRLCALRAVRLGSCRAQTVSDRRIYGVVSYERVCVARMHVYNVLRALLTRARSRIVQYNTPHNALTVGVLAALYIIQRS
jgi:hypothetical protein